MIESADPGFLIVPDVFLPDEIAALSSAIEGGTLKRSKAGARHVLRLPEVRKLANDDRLLQMARTALGGAPIPFRATLFDKSMNGNWLVAWHQDTALPVSRRFESRDWGPWTTKDGVV